MSSMHSLLVALENFPATWSRRQGQGGRLPVAYNSNGKIDPVLPPELGCLIVSQPFGGGDFFGPSWDQVEVA